MKKLFLLASSLIMSTLVTSCSFLDEDDTKYYENLKEVKIVNRLSSLKESSELVKSEALMEDSQIENELFDIKVLSVSRALRIETEPSKYIESEVPVYTKKEKGETVTDSEGNVIYKVDDNGEFILDENGEKIPEVYEEDKFVVSDTITRRTGIRDIVVNKFDSVEVTIQVLPTLESNITSAELFRDSLKYGLLTSSNYILEMEDGSLLSPFMVTKGSDIRTFVLEFSTQNSTESYDKFFNSDVWGETLQDENVNEIISLEFKNSNVGISSYFKKDITYTYEYIEEARNVLVAEAIQKYNVLSSIPFEEFDS